MHNATHSHRVCAVVDLHLLKDRHEAAKQRRPNDILAVAVPVRQWQPRHNQLMYCVPCALAQTRKQPRVHEHVRDSSAARRQRARVARRPHQHLQRKWVIPWSVLRRVLLVEGAGVVGSPPNVAPAARAPPSPVELSTVADHIRLAAHTRVEACSILHGVQCLQAVI